MTKSKSKSVVDTTPTKKDKILADFLKLRRSNAVSVWNLKELGHSAKAIEWHYGSLEKLEKFARAEYPQKFFDVYLKDIYVDYPQVEEFRKKIKDYNKFFITTAGIGCFVNEAALASVKQYCRFNNALLIVLIAADPSSAEDWTIDKNLIDHLLLEEININSNLFISGIKLSLKQINPLTGLQGIGQKKGSFIFASPKQDLKYIPTVKEIPHAIMTTGAITDPKYKPKHRYRSERTAYIANENHIMGGIIVEKEDNNFYHFRQVQFSKSGSFSDMGIYYSSDKGPIEVYPLAQMWGDLHSGETDPVVWDCSVNLAKTLKPKYGIIEDGFNGLSINHHEEKENILRAQKFAEGKISLYDELKKYCEDIDYLATLYNELIIVRSNHDDFLDRYLQHGLYVKDPINHRIALELASALLDGHNPLQYAAEKIFKIKSKNIRWLKRDESFKISGVEVGAHGDKGPNGSRGNIQNLYIAYGNGMFGHNHSAGIFKGAFQVGTSTSLRLRYNVGPSSWTQTMGFIYQDGMKQLVNVINKKTHIKRRK